MISFAPIKAEELALPSTVPVGTTFITEHCGEQHVILKHYCGYVSLTNPKIAWDNHTHFTKVIKYVNIEAKIID